MGEADGDRKGRGAGGKRETKQRIIIERYEYEREELGKYVVDGGKGNESRRRVIARKST